MDSTFSVSIPLSGRSRSPFSALTAVASRLTSAVFALNVCLDRRTTALPGLSDKALARLSRAARYEDEVRWNVMAQKHGATRSTI